MHVSRTRSTAALVAAVGLALAACGSDTDDDASASPPAVGDPADSTGPTDETDTAPVGDTDGAAATDLPTIVVTTNVLGDVLEAVVGDAAAVITIMPVGADPHDFQASAQEVEQLMDADALIVNGGAYEEGLLDVIESAQDDGVPTHEALSAVATIEFGDGGHDHDEHSEDEHSEEEHDHSDDEHDEHSEDEHDHSEEEHDHSDDEHDEHSEDEHDDGHGDEDHGHDHSGEDPHFFTDPLRMVTAIEGIVDFLQDTVEFADPAAVDASADSYLAELAALDAEVAEMVASIPEAQRVLLTNHQVFGYFADRYGFEMIGAVIPSGSTLDSASGGDLAELAETITAEGVPAIFSDTSASDELIQTLADEVGDIDVVALFTESLGAADGDGGTYLDMVRTNATRISSALS